MIIRMNNDNNTSHIVYFICTCMNCSDAASGKVYVSAPALVTVGCQRSLKTEGAYSGGDGVDF